MGGREVCVCYFVEILGQSQPKVSRHLAYLRRAGIVAARREGKWIHYEIVVPLNLGGCKNSERDLGCSSGGERDPGGPVGTQQGLLYSPENFRPSKEYSADSYSDGRLLQLLKRGVQAMRVSRRRRDGSTNWR